VGWGLAATPCAGGFGVGADPSAPTATNSNFSVGSSTWLLLNLNVSGYFRVNYNQENWDQLLQPLSNNHQVRGTPIPHTPHTPHTPHWRCPVALALLSPRPSPSSTGHRSSMTPSTWPGERCCWAAPSGRRGTGGRGISTLPSPHCRAQQVSVTLALNTTRFLSGETAYMPWQAALNNLQYFQLMFDRSEVFGAMTVSTVPGGAEGRGCRRGCVLSPAHPPCRNTSRSK